MREHMTATVRGLVVFGAVWQALWFAGDPALRGTVTAGGSRSRIASHRRVDHCLVGNLGGAVWPTSEPALLLGDYRYRPWPLWLPPG